MGRQFREDSAVWLLDWNYKYMSTVGGNSLVLFVAKNNIMHYWAINYQLTFIIGQHDVRYYHQIESGLKQHYAAGVGPFCPSTGTKIILTCLKYTVLFTMKSYLILVY